MNTESTITNMTEIINQILQPSIDMIMKILASPFGIIPLALIMISMSIKIFSFLFRDGYRHSYISINNDIVEDYENDEIEEEIILSDDLVQQELKCRNCGAKLNLKKIKNSIIECEYCNTQYLIKNEE